MAGIEGTGASNRSDRAAVREAARAHAFDHYLSALLARRRVRDDLVALAAFAGEVARIPLAISEPMMGEIRLQWWRDALGAPESARTGNPVADAMNDVVRRHHLSRDVLMSVVDARASDLYADPLPDAESRTAYLAAAHGGPLRLAARVLGFDPERGFEPLFTAASEAYGLTMALMALPAYLAHGRLPPPLTRLPDLDMTSDALDPATLRPLIVAALPSLTGEVRARLAKARQLSRAAPRDMMTALLPLALVEPYLRALEDAGHDPLRDLADISPLQRVWRLWLAHHRGRI